MMTATLQPKNIVQQPGGERTYTFASYPRALLQQCGFNRKAKYREQVKIDEQILKYGNIMYDRRVIRGSTIPHHTVSVGVPMEPADVQKQYTVRRRVIGQRAIRGPIRTLSPPPVRGRQHVEVQTEVFLEELAAAMEVYDEECQTDPFLDRPPSPMFVMAKTGIDQETQIHEGELFDFDLEVTPLLEVIVGKTVEQSLLEVIQEEEMACLREQQHRYEEERYAQIVEQQRLEEQERRLREEKDRRVHQHELAIVNQEETAEKVAAFAFAQHYLADLAPTVFQNLMDSSYFYDPVFRDIEQSFMPWLMNQVVTKLNDNVLERAILDEIVSEIVVAGAKKFKPLRPGLPGVLESADDFEDITAVEETAAEDSVSIVESGEVLIEGGEEFEGEWEAGEEEEEEGLKEA